ncbi:cAMP-dependent protein kinase type II regulatory subunit-like [Agrilus planipennis]|uniref:cAMP-dependent protein kinase type II regulatory subunit-like n=1 Tax=Agrilus planipennis TaxID=224129 RepID=A0A1W4X6L6_AGRPL|nr:cAMP-dependent protein kinase type II regulatory subunit-like [Agrilus planipennis]
MNFVEKKTDPSMEVRDVLLDYTLNYLLDQPQDVLSYTIDFFRRLQGRKTVVVPNEATGRNPSTSSSSSSEGPAPRNRNERRRCVFAETYDPEDDDDEDYEKVVHPKTKKQRAWLSKELKHIFLFRALDAKHIEEVLDAMFFKGVKSGDVIIKQGEDGDNFYIIEKGVYNVYVTSRPGERATLIKTYDEKGSFGELSLLYNQPRYATIIAETEGTLWGMERMAFKRIVLKATYLKRKMYEKFLADVPLLQKLSQYDLMNLADALVPMTFKPNDIIIKEGDKPDGMYFVEEGVVKIAVLDDYGEYAPINLIENGGYFGEMALITDKPRAASAFAVGDVKVAFLDLDAFNRLLGSLIGEMEEHFESYAEVRTNALNESRSHNEFS